VAFGLSLQTPPSKKKSSSPQNQPNKNYPASDKGNISVGERIQTAKTVQDLLEAATQLWLPTDPDLAPHLIQQQIHHEKRLRSSSQLIAKLGSMLVNDHENEHWELKDPRLERAVLAAAIPYQTGNDRVEKEARYLKEALCGIHHIIAWATIVNDPTNNMIGEQTLNGIHEMFQRAEGVAHLVPLPDAIEMRWACRGLRLRLGLEHASAFLPTLEARASRLPFDIVPACIDWKETLPDAVDRLQEEIPFSFDSITTRTGAKVTERRGTAWIADQGIGALAYSGKLMTPQPISPVVSSIMRQVEEHVLLLDSEQSASAYPRPFFDCALCNHYPDGESACKFHTDPEHGSHWERLTCVVAAGEPRRFAFRPIPGVSTWSEWEHADFASSVALPQENHAPTALTLFPGDVVKMFGSCNDDFHHAVYPGDQNKRDNVDQDHQGRISLVLKRAIARNGGQKGHGIAGQGRRSRRRATSAPSTSSPSMSSKSRRRRRT